MVPRLLYLASSQVRCRQTVMTLGILWCLLDKFLTNPYRLINVAASDLPINVSPRGLFEFVGKPKVCGLILEMMLHHHSENDEAGNENGQKNERPFSKFSLHVCPSRNFFQLGQY